MASNAQVDANALLRSLGGLGGLGGVLGLVQPPTAQPIIRLLPAPKPEEEPGAEALQGGAAMSGGAAAGLAQALQLALQPQAAPQAAPQPQQGLNPLLGALQLVGQLGQLVAGAQLQPPSVPQPALADAPMADGTKRRRKRKGDNQNQQAAVTAVAAAGGGVLAQFQAQLLTTQGGPAVNVPTQQQGIAWDRFLFHCNGCTSQNASLFKEWTLSPKQDWKRDGQTKYENKARDNSRRADRIVQCGLKTTQLDTLLECFGAFGNIFPAIVKLNDSWLEYLSKPSLANGELALEKVTNLLTEISACEGSRSWWKGGERIPPLQKQSLQELKLCATSRQKPFQPKIFLLHMNHEICVNLLPAHITNEFAEAHSEWVAPANRQEELLRSYWMPHLFQYRLWTYGFKVIGDYAKPDVPTLKDIITSFFKCIFAKEFKCIADSDKGRVPTTSAEPAGSAEPAAKRQRTEASDGQDESEDDSNFDNIDCDEFDQELWSPEERGELATAKVLLSDAAVQDAKLVCATVWPLNFGTDALAKVVAMIKPEPTSDKTQFVQALMSKCDAFKQLGKLAVSTHTSWVEFCDWVKTTSVTWTALDKFEKETDDILTTSGSQAEENHGNIVQSITVWSQAATERRRFETLKKSAKLLHDLPTLFPDDRILGDYAIVFKEKKNKVINLVTSIATLSKRLYFSTLAHLLRMAPAAPGRVPLITAMENLICSHLGMLASLQSSSSCVLVTEPMATLTSRIRALQKFCLTGCKIHKQHYEVFEDLSVGELEVTDATQSKYHELCADVRYFKNAVKEGGEMSWAVPDAAPDHENPEGEEEKEPEPNKLTCWRDGKFCTEDDLVTIDKTVQLTTVVVFRC